MKISDILAVPMQPVTRARNLDSIAWKDGYLLVRYQGRPTLYVFGPDISEAQKDSILKNPYPDRLFNVWRVKFCWKSHKIEVQA